MDLTKDSLKSIIAKINSNLKELGVEGHEAEIDNIQSALATLDNDGKDTLQSLSTATTEAITRKKKVRFQDTVIQDQGIEIDLLKEAQKDDKTDQELKDLRAFKVDTVKGQVKSFGDTLATIKDHPNFEKAKDLFKLPDPDKEGVFDLSAVSEEDMSHNLDELGKLNKLSYFETDGGDGKKKDVDGNKGAVIPKGMEERIKSAKTQKELEVIQQELAS